MLNLYTDKEFEDRIFSTFDADLNVSDNASVELKRLRNSYKSTKDNLKSAISKLLGDDSFVLHLQDTIYTTREGRTVFQVKATDKNKVAGIVHDISASNQTYFIEPSSLVPLNNNLRQFEIELNEEFERFFWELKKEFLTFKNELPKGQNALS